MRKEEEIILDLSDCLKPKSSHKLKKLKYRSPEVTEFDREFEKISKEQRERVLGAFEYLIKKDDIKLDT